MESDCPSVDVQLSLVEETYVEEFDALLVGLKSPVAEKYPAKEHARRVAKQLAVEGGLIYLVGLPTEVYGDSDMGPQFRQRRYFYYLSGVDFADCILAYDIARDHLQLFIPPVNPRSAIWFGPSPGIEDCKEAYDVDEVALTTAADLNGYVMKWLKKTGGHNKLYVLHPEQCPPLFESCNLPSFRKILNTDLLQPAMDIARVTKTDYEIKMMRKANEISAAAHLKVLKGLRHFKNESEIEATFLSACVEAKAKHQAYGVIAASGENPSILHYMKNDEPLEGRQLVCLDAGSEWQCYASDVTRTFPISGTYSKEAKAIYDLVALAQEGYIKQMKPGASFHELGQWADKTIAKGLLDVGLLHNGSLEDCLAVGVQGAFFPHSVGHQIGLECHDVLSFRDVAKQRLHPQGILPRNNNSLQEEVKDIKLSASLYPTEPIMRAGMVITVEPGIYFSHYGFKNIFLKDPEWAHYINVELLDKYFSIGGVRIEDDILITEDGYENLTTALKGEAACKVIRGED